MAAYVIVDIDVHDPERYEGYKQLAGPTVSAYGGRYLVRGGAVTPLEGDWMPRRLVVLEFETAAQALAWWNSPEYAPAKELRQQTARTQMVLVEGV